MPRPPEQRDAGEMMFYEIRVLREQMLQGSLFYAVRTSVDTELLGFETTPNMRRGQWVQYCLYVLHVAQRDGRELAPKTRGAQVHRLDGIVRRLAHELPEASGFPRDVLPTLARVYTDWQQADEAYGRVPSRWTDEQTVAAPWLLGRSCGQYLTRGDEVGAQEVASAVATNAAELVGDLGLPEFWKRLAQMLAASGHG